MPVSSEWRDFLLRRDMATTDQEIFTPQRFKREEWAQDDLPAEPLRYDGTRFPFSAVSQLIRSAGRGKIQVAGLVFKAKQLQLEQPTGDDNFPVYFVLIGETYSYLCSFWLDRAEIQVWMLGADSRKTGVPGPGDRRISTMFPVYRAELERALLTIANDARAAEKR
jgi:hypothetical protein